MVEDLPPDWGSDAWGFESVPAPSALSAVDYALGRLPEFVYYYSSFTLPAFWKEHAGHPARFVYQVFDCEDDAYLSCAPDLEWSEVVLTESERKQVRILVGRDQGRVLEVKFQGVVNGTLKPLFTLKGEHGERFADLVRSLEYLPITGSEQGRRVAGDLMSRILNDPASIAKAYEQSPEVVAQLISSNVNAKDVIALANRQEQVAIFRHLLEDPEFFAARRQEVDARGPEEVWQKFFEENPWILGVGLSGQLLTSWDPAKLEQVVVGASAVQAGKRTDALMATVGAISSMVFAEIKHHETDLLHQVRHPYRPAVWAPSPELAGGVTQIQQTVYLAREVFKEQVLKRDESGRQTGDSAFFIRPRCYLIVGHMDEIAPDGAVDPDKFRSFELYRRNLYEPEIVTFDELLARAEWHVAEAERESQSGE